MKKILILLMLFSVAALVYAGPPVDPEYNLSQKFYPAAGGLNLFSSPSNIAENQALNLENFLFEGTHLRARKGFNYMNTTSKGGTPIWGVYKFIKSSAAYQYLASWGGSLWVFDEDDEEFSTLIQESDIEDSCIVTNASATVTGATSVKSHFRDYGYADSLALYLGDSLRYVKQILNDSLIILYTPWGGDTETRATTEPFRVSEYYPTRIVTWLDNAYIVGTQRLGEYDGDDAALQSATPLKYNVLRVDPWVEPQFLALTCTPNREKGYLYFMRWYVSYNDTNTSTDSHSVVLNIPLQVALSNEIEDSTILYVFADSSYEEHISVAAWDSILMIPEFAYVETVATIIPDSVERTVISAEQLLYVYHVYDYSALPAADSNKYNYGHYRLLGFQNLSHYPVRARVNASDTAYFYLMVKHALEADTVGEGDTLHLVRYSESAPRPNVARYMEIYQDRAWYAGYADDPSLVRYSVDFDPDSFYSVSGAPLEIYVAADDGDIITCLKAMPLADILLVGKKKHIYAISGEGVFDWWVSDIAHGIGMPAWASVVSHGPLVYFYDYSGFYVLNELQPQKISWQIEPIVKDSINKDYAHLIIGGYFDNHIWWSYPSGSATKNNRAVVYNIENNAWAKIDRPFSALFVGLRESDEYGVLVGDPDSGRVYRYGNSYFDEGSANSASYESGWLNFGDDAEYIKRYHDIRFLFDKHDSTLIYTYYYNDYSDTAFAEDTIGIDNSDIFRLYKRPIRGDEYGTRFKLKLEATRIDETLQIPFYQIKWKPTTEPAYDE